MGIHASLELENGKHLPLTPLGIGSKAICTLVDLLSLCCEASASEPNSELATVTIWLSNLRAKMTEDLCILWQAMYGYWDYLENEYDRYVSEQRTAEVQEVLTKDDFIKVCQEIEQKWVNTTLMLRCVKDLIRVLQEIQPSNTWWYTAEDTLADLRFLAQTLSQVQASGHERVRIYYS